MNRVRYFVVPGDPQGKGRPRSVTRNGQTVHYTPERTRNYEELVRWCYKEKNHEEPFPKGVSLVMTMDVFYAVPERTSEKRRSEMLNGVIRPTKKPDASNVLKAIEDAMNKVAYYDDSQLVSVHVTKYYGPEPMVKVWISEAE